MVKRNVYMLISISKGQHFCWKLLPLAKNGYWDDVTDFNSQSEDNVLKHKISKIKSINGSFPIICSVR